MGGRGSLSSVPATGFQVTRQDQDCNAEGMGYTLGSMDDELEDAPNTWTMPTGPYGPRNWRSMMAIGSAADQSSILRIFYAANAMLELDGLERSKHSAVLALFRQRYIKTGLIETEFSSIYAKAFESRNE